MDNCRKQLMSRTFSVDSVDFDNSVNDVGGPFQLAHPVWRWTRAFANPLFLFRVFILSCFRDSPIRLVLSGILNGTR